MFELMTKCSTETLVENEKLHSVVTTTYIITLYICFKDFCDSALRTVTITHIIIGQASSFIHTLPRYLCEVISDGAFTVQILFLRIYPPIYITMFQSYNYVSLGYGVRMNCVQFETSKKITSDQILLILCWIR